MDCDDISLPDVANSCEYQYLIDRYRPPLGTISLDDETPPSIREIHNKIGRQEPSSRLLACHCELADAKTKTLLQWITPYNKRISPPACPGHQEGQELVPYCWLIISHGLSNLLEIAKTPNTFSHLRTLELDNNGITNSSLAALCDYVSGNGCLRKLSLKANLIGGEAEPLSQLAHAVGHSVLRGLELSSNPLGVEAFIAFIKALPSNGTSLSFLELSCVLSDPASVSIPLSNLDALDAARSVADFLKNERRYRGLRRIGLNGNKFGYRGVRAIVAAVIGSAYHRYKLPHQARLSLRKSQKHPLYGKLLALCDRRPNRSLENVSLFGNVDLLSNADDSNPDAHPRNNSSLSQYFLPRGQRDVRRLNDLAGGVEFGPIAHSSGVEHDQDSTEWVNCQLPRATSVLLPKQLASLAHQDPQQAAVLINQLSQMSEDFLEAQEIGSGVDHADWKTLLEARLSLNKKQGCKVRRTSLNVLSVARTVACASRKARSHIQKQEANHSRETDRFDRFLDLPLELRLLVLQHLDEECVLSQRQFRLIISWASDRSTIGYGEPDYNWSSLLHHLTHGANPNHALYPTLPVETWSWIECFSQRSAPRDWTCDLIDSDQGMDGFCQEQSSLRVEKVTSVNKPLRPISCATLAFWECTMTDRPDGAAPYVDDCGDWQNDPDANVGFTTGTTFSFSS